MVDWLGLYKHEIASFFALDAASTQAVDRPVGGNSVVHYLRTANPLNPENPAASQHRVATNRSNPYVGPLGYKNFPLKVFGTYACTTNPVPTLAPTVNSLVPQQLKDLINQFAYNNGNVPAPPCVEQSPNGQLIGQGGKYAQVKVAPER